MATKGPWNGPTFVIVSGANRGYGLAVAEVLIKRLTTGSVLVITARNASGLKEAEEKLVSLKVQEDVCIKPILADLGNDKDVSSFITKCLKGLDIDLFKSSMLIHNASSLGDVQQRVQEYSDPKIIADYMKFNVANVMFLTSQFLAAFSNKSTSLFIVNVSSLCAIEPFASCGLYCTGKAARDMLFKVLAVERKDVRVLNWAPGPMPTRMMSNMMNSCDEGIANFFQTMSREKTYVECAVSASKLITILEKNHFSSGAHIDYYDDIDGDK